MNNRVFSFPSLFVPILISMFALAFLILWPMNLTASTDNPEDIAGASVPAASAEVSEVQDVGGASASGTAEVQDVGGASEAGNPDEVAGASEHHEAYEPLPVEPIQRHVNNSLLGGGLGASALFFGGAIIMDKRKEGKEKQ
ncbi:MAG TPA: hypothetical protein GXX46_00035 [Peptococcaceae bacterium]|nr:hypothetical protein [Peptococcaceae bacterium]